MKLTTHDLIQLKTRAEEAALMAGALIQKASLGPISALHKTGGSSKASQVLTEVDLASEKMILKHLIHSMTQYDLGLLTEESPDNNSRFEKDNFWCIDPLDGTQPFTEGRAGYSVSIALVAKDGTPQIGVVYDPVKDTLYSAASQLGVFRNKKKWVSKTASKEVVYLTFDRSFMEHPKFEDVIKSLQQTLRSEGLPSIKVDQYGGAVLNAIQIAENAPAAYFKFPKDELGGGSLWDYAATACIFKELGLTASDIFGNSIDLNRKDSTFLNHRGIVYASDKRIALLTRKEYQPLM